MLKSRDLIPCNPGGMMRGADVLFQPALGTAICPAQLS
jgi:hypothetical protein